MINHSEIIDWVKTNEQSVMMQTLYQRIYKVAMVDVSVLLFGETGVGKELAARSIHAHSSRKDQPFVAINCAALHDNLIESQLFGYRKGSFTDATEDHVGYFMSADGGTLFLDEIGELSLLSQVKLLRVLQEHQVTALGSHQAQPINIRLICATHVNLRDAIQKQLFRKDLYYRINTVELHVPPLRDRKEDLLPLVDFFIKKYAEQHNVPLKTLTQQAKSLLSQYSWPGNVRELQNVIVQAMIFSESVTINPQDLKLNHVHMNQLKPLAEAKDEFIRHYIDEALAQCAGNRQKAAKLLQVNVRTIFRYLDKKDD